MHYRRLGECGVWAGMIIGALDGILNEPWHGGIAHCSVWNWALTLAEIQDLYAV